MGLAIVVRVHGPGPNATRGATRLVLGMLLQSIAARFDSEAPYYSANLCSNQLHVMEQLDMLVLETSAFGRAG